MGGDNNAMRAGPRGLEKLLATWTPDALAANIAEGERLLTELRDEPLWMSEVLTGELGRRREWLGMLRSR